MISREEHVQGLTFVTVSEIGSNHRALLMPNQDYADYFIDGDDYVLAVSDGVGSCSKADLGSKSAVEACIHTFSRLKDKTLEFDSKCIVAAIINEWQTLLKSESIDDCCATLKAIFKVGQVMKVISVGDGFVAISSDGINLLSPSEERNFTNETSCLCSTIRDEDCWTGEFNLDIRKPYVAFCCTDGVANGIVHGQELNLIREIEENIQAESLKEDLESFLKEISNYCFDDKTVGVIKYE